MKRFIRLTLPLRLTHYIEQRVLTQPRPKADLDLSVFSGDRTSALGKTDIETRSDIDWI